MANITNEQINEVRNKNDIVNVISNYISLTKKGKNYFGVCPFHDDHSPSMSVSVDKQIYTCFSCGASGNVFTFVSEYEHISFYEAVVLLGKNVGIELDNNFKKKVTNQSFSIYESATCFYQNNLYSNLGKSAIDYLKQRNIDEDAIEKFRIGLSINNVSITEYLEDKKYDLKTLIDLGLTADNGKDLFMGRIMFPLFDLSGNVVAFSGRRYNTNDGSKYINTKETKIFKKGSLLYNYHNARENLKKNSSVIVMEGFMDVIRASTVGINNCVATMGTALTKDNAILLSKMSDNIILCFDGDRAGEEATLAAIKIFEDINVSPKIVRLDNDLDPDEYILKNGKEDFLYKINNSINSLDYKMNLVKHKVNLMDTRELSKYIDYSLKELSKVKDDILVNLTLKKISSEYNVDYKLLVSKYENYKKVDTKKESKIVIKKNNNLYCDKYIKAQANLLYYMIKSVDVIEYTYDKINTLPNDKLRYLYNDIISFYDKYKTFNIADFISFLNGRDEIVTFNEIMGLNLKEEYTKEEIDDYVYLIVKYPKEFKIKKLEKDLKEETNPIKQAQILSEIMKIKGVINDGRRD